MAYRVIVLALAIIELVGCAECVTEGCDALRDRAPGHHSGIGGVVASQSDVVAMVARNADLRTHRSKYFSFRERSHLPTWRALQ